MLQKKIQRDPKAQGKNFKLFSNYFQIEFNSKVIKSVNNKTVIFEPSIPDNSKDVRKSVLKLVKDKIEEKLDFFIDWGLCVFILKRL